MYQLVYPAFFEKYVRLALSEDLIGTLETNTTSAITFFEEIPDAKRDYAYAEQKWTIKQVLQHIIDTERVFAYRCLRIARFDSTPLPGFDENLFADHAPVGHRSWKDMIKEFKQLRKANIRMIKSLSEEQLHSTGTASNSSINAVALAFIMAGHVTHHINITQERYL